jgi:hypothetical protein
MELQNIWLSLRCNAEWLMICCFKLNLQNVGNYVSYFPCNAPFCTFCASSLKLKNIDKFFYKFPPSGVPIVSFPTTPVGYVSWTSLSLIFEILKVYNISVVVSPNLNIFCVYFFSYYALFGRNAPRFKFFGYPWT